jgi:hypothetical protein
VLVMENGTEAGKAATSGGDRGAERDLDLDGRDRPGSSDGHMPQRAGKSRLPLR